MDLFYRFLERVLAHSTSVNDNVNDNGLTPVGASISIHPAWHRCVMVTLESLRSTVFPSYSACNFPGGPLEDSLFRMFHLVLPLLSSPLSPSLSPLLVFPLMEDMFSIPLNNRTTSISLLQAILPVLTSLCPAMCTATSADTDTLASFTRLLITLVQTKLKEAETSPTILSLFTSLLNEFSRCCCCAPPPSASPLTVLAATEVWHAVMTYVECLEESSSWEYSTESNKDAFNAMHRGFKDAILLLTSVLLSTLLPDYQQQQQSPPPFVLDNLDTSVASGAALEDWILELGGGGGAQREEEETMMGDGDGDGDGDKDEFLDAQYGKVSHSTIVPSGCDASHSRYPSAADVFALHAEYFIAHAISTHAAILVPIILNYLPPALEAELKTSPSTQDASSSSVHVRAVLALRLVARCAPHLPATRLSRDSDSVKLVRGIVSFGRAWMEKYENEMVLRGGGGGRSGVGEVTFRTLSPLMTTWLSQIVLIELPKNDQSVEEIVVEVVQDVLNLVASAASALLLPDQFPRSATNKEIGLAATQTLLSLTSVALSSAMKPPIHLLTTASSCPAVAAVLTPLFHSVLTATTVDTSVYRHTLGSMRPLAVGLSDLAFRSWGGVDATETVTTTTTTELILESRLHVFSHLIHPVLHYLTSSLLSLSAPPSHTPSHSHPTAIPVLVTRFSALLAIDIVNSYTGSQRAIRAGVFQAMIKPSLDAIIPALVQYYARADVDNSTRSMIGAPLLKYIAACLYTFPAEIKAEGVGQILHTLVGAFTATARNTPFVGGQSTETPRFADDLEVLGIIKHVLSQRGTKNAALVVPAMRFALQFYEQVCRVDKYGEKEIPAANVSVMSTILAALLHIISHHWRLLLLSSSPAPATPAPTPTSTTPTGQPMEVALLTIHHLCQFFRAAADGQIMPSSTDVRCVLEELYDVQVTSKLNWMPFFSNTAIGTGSTNGSTTWSLKESLMDSCLTTLRSLSFQGAQDQLIDTLYGLASSNWSEFLLQFLPRYAEQRLGHVGGGAGAGATAHFGMEDMDANAFERAVLAYVNDVVYLEERAKGGHF